MSIEVKHISKTFGTFAALQDVSLRIADGELVAMLGPSGSGKTTLLRIIAGLEIADERADSALLFHDESVRDRPVRQRGVGFVFQHYALFRHMTVFENVAFGLRVRPRRQRPGRRDIAERVQRLLNLVQLDGLAHRRPSQLSGGQRQRVALARALAVEPRVLLLDEPFGALDAKVRQELRLWLRRLHDEIHVTSVFVTHDQEEALEVADRVVVMNKGRIVQVGPPEQVFHEPADEFVMGFLGHVNVFHSRVTGGKAFIGDVAVNLTSTDAAAAARRDANGAAAGGAGEPDTARVFVRPHEWDFHLHRNGQPCLEAVICHIHAAGPQAKVTLLSESGEPIKTEMPIQTFRDMHLATGQRVFISPRRVKVFMDAY